MRHTESWHIINAIDPLVDSDDEIGDDHVRLDYSEHSTPVCVSI